MSLASAARLDVIFDPAYYLVNRGQIAATITREECLHPPCSIKSIDIHYCEVSKAPHRRLD
jgi:hypothetical protein